MTRVTGKRTNTFNLRQLKNVNKEIQFSALMKTYTHINMYEYIHVINLLYHKTRKFNRNDFTYMKTNT